MGRDKRLRNLRGGLLETVGKPPAILVQRAASYLFCRARRNVDMPRPGDKETERTLWKIALTLKRFLKAWKKIAP
jgi:hypothetical protein